MSDVVWSGQGFPQLFFFTVCFDCVKGKFLLKDAWSLDIAIGMAERGTAQQYAPGTSDYALIAGTHAAITTQTISDTEGRLPELARACPSEGSAPASFQRPDYHGNASKPAEHLKPKTPYPYMWMCCLC